VATFTRGNAYTVLKRVDGRKVNKVKADVSPDHDETEIIGALMREVVPKLQMRFPGLEVRPGGSKRGQNESNTMTLSLCGTLIEQNEVVQHGSAIFFVSNDHSGDVRIDQSTITSNTGGSWYPTYPQISGHADTPIVVTDSTNE
jgi:hypothetical protein